MLVPNAIVSFASGPWLELLDLARPSFERYAANCKADLILDTTSYNPDYPLFDRLHIRDYLASFDRCLVLDCDLVIRQDTPNLFDLVPVGIFAAVDESKIGSQFETVQRWRAANRLALANEKPYPQWQHYLNLGVWMADGSHTELFGDPAVFTMEAMGEQGWINLQLHWCNTPIYNLDRRFNMYTYYAPPNYLVESYVLHAADGSIHKKQGEMETFLRYWNE